MECFDCRGLLREDFSSRCKLFFFVVCYLCCVSPTFSFERNKEVFDVNVCVDLPTESTRRCQTIPTQKGYG